MSEQATLITGGTGGLGRAVVANFLRKGDRVVVPWHSEAEVEGLNDYLAQAGIDARPEMLQADMTSTEGIAAAIDLANQEGGFRNAILLVGGFSMGPIDQTGPNDWDKLVALNATTVFRAAKAAFPVLRQNGGGRIVTVAAHPALDRGTANMAAYAATKSAVVSLTRSLAKEGGKDGIRVNAVAPDVIDTPANRSAMPDGDPAKWLTPDEIAGVIGFLTGEAGGVVNGAILTLTKG